MSKRIAEDFYIGGAVAQSNRRWIWLKRRDAEAWLPETAFLDERAARMRLGQAGIVLIGKAWQRVRDEVANLDEFTPRLIFEQPGWTGDAFALPDGTCFTPKGMEDGVVAFARKFSKCRKSGDFEGWLDLAEELGKHTLPSFVMMLAFAAPLIELLGVGENFIIELVGGRGCGKSTIQYLMSSAVGPVANTSAGKYWCSFDSTMNGLETAMLEHNGLPFVINEANLFYRDQPEAKRADLLTAVVFRLSQGHEKQRHDGSEPLVSRFVCLTSSNESFARLIQGQSKEVADAAVTRMITLQVPTSRPFGVFDTVPDGYLGSEAYAKALYSMADEHHGHAFPLYVARLVEALADDKEALLAEVRESMARFRVRAGSSVNDGGVARIDDAFAMTYAAGALAKRFGVLPESFLCGPSALETYRTFYKSFEPRQSFEERLRAIVNDPAAISLEGKKLPRLTDDEFAAVPAFVSKDGSATELIFRPGTLKQWAPDWAREAKSLGPQVVWNREEQHRTVYRKVRRGSRQRMVSFTLLPTEA